MLARSSTRGNTFSVLRLAPAVARLVEVQAHAVAVQVDDVGGAAAVDVGQADALVVELVGVVEPRRVVHRDLGAEAAIAQVGPVADLAVADADDVGQAVAGQVGEVDGLRAVGEDDARAFLLVERLRDAPGRAEALFGQRGVPDEGVVFGDQHVGVAVAVEIDELEVRVAQVAVQARGEGAERLPAFGLVVLVQAGRRAVHDDHVGLAVAGQVHELRAAAQGDVGFEGDGFERGELRLRRPPCRQASSAGIGLRLRL